jgi:UDP-glucose 4-epimerase
VIRQTELTRKVIVCGSTGFIGGALIKASSRDGWEAQGWSRQWEDDKTLRVDYEDVELLSRRISEYQPDALINCAGPADVAAAFRDPIGDFLTSVQTWGNILEATRLSKFRPHLVFVSSAAVYGQPEVLPIDEATRVSPLSPYGFHKLACESLGLEYSRCFGLDVSAVRVFSTYGVDQQRLLIWELCRQLLLGETGLRLKGTGEELRDYLHVDDLASAILSVAEIAPASFQVINAGSGTSVSTRDLAELLLSVAETEGIVTCSADPQLGQPSRWIVDNSALRSHLKTPSLSLDVGLRRCWESWRNDFRGRMLP